MTRRTLAVGTAVSLIVLGCGSLPQQPAQVPAPQPPVVVVKGEKTAAPEPTGDVETTGNAASKVPEPDRLARQAEEHAKAIEALLTARSQEDPAAASGVRVIPPAPRNTPPANVPVPVKPIQAGVKPAPEAIFVTPEKPVDPIDANAATANTAVSVASVAPSPIKADVVKSPPAPVTPSNTESLEQQLARRAREYPRDLPSQLDYQLVLFTRDEQVPRAADIANLPTEDREVLTALIDGLTNFRNGVRADTNMLMNRKIRPLIEMSDRLRSRSDLSIPNAVLCKEVRAWGNYTPIESQKFEAGMAHTVIVYAEVENFASTLNEKNLWETRLEGQLALYNESGWPVWEDKFPAIDVCRNRRRDFFLPRKVTIPASLNLGRYVLKVTVTDQQASRIAESSIPIVIVAK